eukprot:TRINITY_DN2753_c0_g1_i1.p2 TRINITY_DN2753_c0_g1~~TRINITY_DN2753_c0_g1_i1.p2  ORF type:complete len:156 (+),score=17.71 TRINITY_DN2753_c0_g1_i1:453-920(+)
MGFSPWLGAGRPRRAPARASRWPPLSSLPPPAGHPRPGRRRCGAGPPPHGRPTAGRPLCVPQVRGRGPPPATHVRGDVRVAAGNGDMLLDLFVTDTRGVVVYHASNVATSAFSFVTSPPSAHSPRMALAPYRLLFPPPGAPPRRRTSRGGSAASP